MSSTPDWLPKLVTLADYGNDATAYLEAIYQFFCDDFIDSKPAYPGKRFALKRYPIEHGKEATFWHLISTGKEEADRLPDLRRWERIRWPRPMIEAMATDRVLIWKNTRSGNQRVIIAIGDFSYVVVLDEREDFVLLWTAYFVEHEHSRRKLKKEYEAWIAAATNG